MEIAWGELCWRERDRSAEREGGWTVKRGKSSGEAPLEGEIEAAPIEAADQDWTVKRGKSLGGAPLEGARSKCRTRRWMDGEAWK